MTLDIKGMVQFAESSFAGAIPAAARAKAKLRLADGLACLYVGAAQEPGQLADRFIARERNMADGRCRILPGSMRSTPEVAAWSHGIKIHAVDWDDWTFILLHATAATLPTALAIAEVRNASIKSMVDAFTAGVEAGMRLSIAINPELYNRGWHPSGTAGAVGAAIAGGLLMGHTGKKLMHDISLSLCQCAGVFANRGTMGKPFHLGNVGRAATMAVLAVDEGFDGADDPFDSKFGFRDTFLAGITARTPDWSTSSAWAITDVWPIKLYPVGGARQSLIAAALSARKRLGTFNPSQVAAITCRVCEVIGHIDHAVPFSWLDSRFSHPYCTAVSIIDGAAGLKQFGQERFDRGDVQALMPRVRILPEAAMGINPLHDGFKSIVEISLTDGRTCTEECLGVLGDNASLVEIRDKVEQVSPGVALAWDASVKILGRESESSLVLTAALANPG